MEDASSPIMSGGASTLVKKTFFNHVFSTTEEGKAELLNVVQYSGLAILPVVILNKLIQRFVPDADPDKSSLEILFEVVLQIFVIFVSLVFIHRSITYLPTYSGFKYDSMALTSVVLVFLVIVLSIQTKMGIKVSILADRVSDMWNGTDSSKDEDGSRVRKKQPISGGGYHTASQADFMDSPQVQTTIFPPAPSTTTSKNAVPKMGMNSPLSFEPVAANSMIGSTFGSLF